VENEPGRIAARLLVSVVDDDESMRESLELAIGHAGCRCETSASAARFLERPREPAPSCLVLDVRPQDLDGLDLRQRVARDRIGMPILFITGYGDVPMSVRAMKAGAIAFLTKPFADSLAHVVNIARRLSPPPAGDRA
jgi:FixJ family two-component response regulator